MKDYLYLKSLQVPIYRGKLIILISNSLEKINKYLPDFDVTEIYAHATLGDYLSEHGYFIILNFNNKNRKITDGVITHEAFHISNYLLLDRGVKADFINDEAQAYLMEWITDQIYKFINKKGLKPQNH